MIRYGDVEVPRAAIVELARRLQDAGDRRVAHKLGHAIDANLDELTLAPEEIGPVLSVMLDTPIPGLEGFHEALRAGLQTPTAETVTEELEVARQKRLAANEAFFREINERLEHERPESELSIVLCECVDEDCAQRLQLTREEYERVRADPRQFVIVPGHADDAIEEVVAHSDRFEIVRKKGIGANVATRLDSTA